MLRAITANWGVPFVLVEGNAELTPARLVGHHNPARVLREDYSSDNFVPGPLVEAMRAGGFLYIEELNRAPGGHAQRAARRRWPSARSRCRGSARSPPADVPGAGVDEPVRQRRHGPDLRLGLRPLVPARRRLPGRGRGGARSSRCAPAATDDAAGRRRGGDHPGHPRAPGAAPRLSVRGAIDLAAIARRAGRARAPTTTDERRRCSTPRCSRCPARIGVDEASEPTPEEVITEIWENHFFSRPRRAAPGSPRSTSTTPSRCRRQPARDRGLAPLRRKPKQLDRGARAVPAGDGRAAGRRRRTGRPRHGDLRSGARRRAGRAGHRAAGAACGRVGDLLEDAGAGPRGRRRWPSDRARGWRMRRRAARPDAAGAAAGARSRCPTATAPTTSTSTARIEVLTERPVPEDTDIIVRERMRSRRSVVLIVDVSGSMRGEKVRMAAATVAALSAPTWPGRRPARAGRVLVRRRAAQAAGGSTPARAAARPAAAHPRPRADQRALRAVRRRTPSWPGSAAPAHGACCSPTRCTTPGPDPRLVARRFPELHVLLQTDGEHDRAARRRPGPARPRPDRPGGHPPRRRPRPQPRPRPRLTAPILAESALLHRDTPTGTCSCAHSRACPLPFGLRRGPDATHSESAQMHGLHRVSRAAVRFRRD